MEYARLHVKRKSLFQGVFVYFLRSLDVWQQYCIARFHYYDGGLRRRTVDSSGNSTWLKTPQNCSKEGQLKPFFANNVDIPFARARRLKPCPRKATVRSGKQSSAYDTVHKLHFKNN